MIQQTTADLVLSALQPYHLKKQPSGEYRCNSPFRPGSNSHALGLTIDDDGEHGAWKDHVSGDGGSLYQLADQLGIQRTTKPASTPTTKRGYAGLDDYAAGHYASPEAFSAAGWRATRTACPETRKPRSALEIPTATGPRYRFIDGQTPPFKSPAGYKACWYRLAEAIAIANATDGVLVLCNGEPSVVTAQHHKIPATCITGSGEKRLPDTLLDELRAAWTGPIMVALDSDDKGRKAAPGLVAQLQAAGYTKCSAVDMHGGDGFDLADWCGLHGTTSITDLLACQTPDTLPANGASTQQKPAQRGTGSAAAFPAAPRLLARHALGTITPTTWLIDGVLAMNKLSQTFAPPGSGKSFTELDKALCVAQRYPVVYIAAEAVEDYHERVSAWEAHHGQTAGAIYFWPEPIALKSAESVEAFLTEIHAIGPAAIFVDPLASCMVGLEESSTGDMTIAVEALNYIRRATGAAVHIVHHTGWSEAHERGSSVLRAACRIVMKLTMDDSGLMTLSCEKANNGKPFESRYFRLVAAADSAVVVPANKVSMRNAPMSEKQFAILETLDLMQFRNGATFSQIQEHTGISKSTVNKAISRLIELGSIVLEGERSVKYRNTAKGNNELADRLGSTTDTASSPVHPHGELEVNWMVNSLGTPRPNAEFTQFTPNHEKSDLVHPLSEQTSSPEFTINTALESASSPQFTSSSPRVHPDEFTSSPPSPPLGGRESEQDTGEHNDIAYRVAQAIHKPRVGTQTARQLQDAELAQVAAADEDLFDTSGDDG